MADAGAQPCRGWPLLEHWHVLSGWQGLRLIYLLFPVVIAWNHAGVFFVVIVVAGELISVQLNAPDRPEKIETALKI